MLAIKIRKISQGAHPITPADFPVQIFAINRKSGDVVKPHKHLPKTRQTENLQECLVVLKGKLKIIYHNSDGKKIKSVTLLPNDLLLSVSGSHSIVFLEDSEVFEIKNGPYLNDRLDF